TDQVMNTKISELKALAEIITPNLQESEAIAGKKITSEQDFKTALKIMRDDMGASNVIIKGGHLEGDAIDYLYDGNDIFTLSANRIDTNQTHGTGCTFSAVLTAELAKKKSVME